MSVYLAAQPDPAAVLAALEREVVHVVLLLELRFASGSRYLCNEVVPFVDLKWGRTWAALGNLVGVDDVEGGPDEMAPLREYRLGLPWEVLTADERARAELGLIPALVSDRDEYVNRIAVLYEQVVSDSAKDTYGRPLPVGHPTALHFGTMDRATASFSARGALLTLSVEGPLARKGAPVYGRLTPRDQQRRHPGDEGLDFVAEVASTIVKWTDW